VHDEQGVRGAEKEQPDEEPHAWRRKHSTASLRLLCRGGFFFVSKPKKGKRKKKKEMYASLFFFSPFLLLEDARELKD
jgi:hypothetical protein